MSVDISIIIVNYNVKAFLEQCLLAINRAIHDLNTEIFVVDNASVDGSQSMVRNRFPNVHLIENKDNLGFSVANNQALRVAQGEYVLILNPDTLIQEDTLLVLKRFLDSHSDVGAVGVKLINPDGSFQITSRRSLPTAWVSFTRIVGLSKLFPKSRIFGKYNMTYLDPDIETDVDVLPGSLMCVRKTVFDEVGYFDEDYFMYGEDVDLCYRITKMGWKIHYVPTTKAIHYKGESTKKSELSFVSNFYRAMLIFANKHFRRRYSIFMRAFLRIGIYTRAFISYLWRVFKYFIAPMLDAVLIVFSIFLAIKLWLPQFPLVRFRIVYPVYVLVWLGCMYLFGAYHKKGRFHLKPVLWSCVTGLLINSTFVYFFKQFAYSRVVVLISFLLIAFFLTLWRVMYRLAGPLSKKAPLSRLRRAIIVGAGKEGKRILKKLQNRPDMSYEVCGFLDYDPKLVGKEIDSTEVLATINNVKDVIRVEHIDDVIFTSDRLSNAQILETIILAQASGVNFRIVPHELEYIVAKSSVDDIETVHMLEFSGVADPLDLIVKRLFDIVASLILLIILSPLLLVNFAIGARFVQNKVMGFMGKPITILRFRKGLPFLRSFPLFFSIVHGGISFVGSEITEYGEDVRHAVYKPGLTGLVQVKAKEKKKALTQNEKDYYNLYYIKNQSIITDLRIILKSLF
jgi:GT2 family glycosyltransferase/lipopolysaccharide/colanic/teichoic acid biosynthesis glycosyltransferase